MHKIFKKALTCVMAGALCLTMAIPAFADDASTGTEENTGTGTGTGVVLNADDYDACLSTAMDIIEGTGEGLTAETLIQMLMGYGFSEETATEVAYSDYIAGFLVSEDKSTEGEDGEDSSSDENTDSEETKSDGEEYAACEEAALDMIATRESMGEEIDRDELIDSLVALGFSKDLATQVVDELLGEERSENNGDEEETGLGIAMTTDKTEYSVNESIFYKIEMSEKTKDATESDVIISDELPEGLHVKEVSVDGSDDAVVTTSIGSSSTSDNSNESTEDANALAKAKEYLETNMGFSYAGLIAQLTSNAEGFSEDAATYAADNCGADWFAEAVKSAKGYMETSSMSYNALVNQLKSDAVGFTNEQAEYGAIVAYGYATEEEIASTCYAIVTVTVADKDAEYVFRNIVDGNAYEYILLGTEETTDNDTTEYVMTFMLFSDTAGTHYVDIWMVEDTSEGTETLVLQTETAFSTFDTASAASEPEKDSVQVYIPTVDYDEPVVVTIEAYADEADTYTNTAIAVSAESDAVSASATIDVVGVSANGTGTVVNENPDSTTGNEGTDDGGKVTVDDNGGKDSGTIQTGDVKTDSTVNAAVLSAIGLTACIGLGASIAGAKKAKAN